MDHRVEEQALGVERIDPINRRERAPLRQHLGFRQPVG
jgi:hypothetical protein